MLLQYVEPIRHFSIFGNNKVIIRSSLFCGEDIYYLFEHIKWAEERDIFFPTVLEIQSFGFKSSDVIIVLELLMLYLSMNFPNLYKVEFSKLSRMQQNIIFSNSLLKKYNGKTLNSSYIKAFYEPIYTLSHYRKVIDKQAATNNYLCTISDEIKYVISNQGVDENLVFEATESLIEIIGNVFEHSDGDCIIDVKISLNINKNIYLCLNVVSLTNVFIGTKLQQLLLKRDTFSGFDLVNKAYPYHSKMFSDSYDMSSFSFVCSFQNSVSTRDHVGNSGGTGFTTLLKNINDKSFNMEYDSYLISGKNTIFFRNEFLKPNNDGIVGFNKTNNFYTDIPNFDIIKKDIYTFPGTIFCVNLVTEQKNEKN